MLFHLYTPVENLLVHYKLTVDQVVKLKKNYRKNAKDKQEANVTATLKQNDKHNMSS